MRHNKPGGFCVYKTALSFSTGAGLAHPAAMRAPLFYLPRASGAQNLACLTAHKILLRSARSCGFSSSTCLELEIFGGPTFLTPIGFYSLLHSCFFRHCPTSSSFVLSASTSFSMPTRRTLGISVMESLHGGAWLRRCGASCSARCACVRAVLVLPALLACSHPRVTVVIPRLL